MGIPHLITHLRPYATGVDLTGQNAVIDGPGLAYHIYYLCLASQPRARNPIEATPSPALLGATVLRWLDEFQKHNVTVKKIYFDGYLPTSKRAIRSSRLANYTKQLATYHQSWPQIIPSVYASPEESFAVSIEPTVDLFGHKAVAPNFTKLPATPFLVPTILEALLGAERYCGITEVVPGEADAYCAQYVKSYGGNVITGDSDLLVHDLGNKGAVVFLKDIEVIQGNRSEFLQCTQYNVASIAERLGLPSPHGICSLAFEMVMDAHGTFRQLLQQAIQERAIMLHEKLFEEFLDEYTSLSPDLNISKHIEGDTSSLSRHLKALDPRISEYILQFPIFAQAASLGGVAVHRARQDVDMFLPFLLDCPTKTSSWEMSTPIRQLAYSLVNLIVAKEQRISTVVEHRRQQVGTKGREWQLPTYDEMVDACTRLVELVDQFQKSAKDVNGLDVWRSIAFHQELTLALRLGKDSSSRSFMSTANSTKVASFRLTWDNIHLSSQLEGSYYSFRILKQVLDTVLSSSAEGISPIFRTLQLLLKRLPSLKSLPTPIGSIRRLSSPEDKAAWTAVNKLLHIEEKGAIVLVPKSKKNRKKRKMNVSSGESGGPQKKVTNMFELLAAD